VTTGRRPADALLHPVSLVCLGVLVVNDHYLKHHHPGWLSGKLSDLTGLVLAPLWLWSILCFLGAAWLETDGRPPAERETPRWVALPPRGLLLISIALVGCLFTAMQTTEAGDALFRHGVGLLQWPVRVLLASVSGGDVPAASPVRATPDPSDLFCLPMLLVAWALGRPRDAGYVEGDDGAHA
jgi:hypothetical protein